MKIFKSVEEIEKYYNEKNNSYEFVEEGRLFDVKFEFDLKITKNIKAGNINALNINAGNIDALDINASDIKASDIKARDIKAGNIEAWNIKAGDIKARDIKARDIKAGNINASDIKAGNIDALDIEARDIKAGNIEARDIKYYAVCVSYQNITCEKIEGSRDNSKHFCLDGEIVFKKDKKKKIIIDDKDIEISEESFEALKKQLINN
jgi:hypothetical protein